MTRPAPGSTVRVGRPPFAFRVEGPDGWHVLRLEPRHWQADVARMLAGGPVAALPAADRRAALQLLEDLVAVAQRTGVVLALVAIGADERRGGLFAGTLALGWVDCAPLVADRQLARLVAGEGARLQGLDAPLGGGVLRSEVLDGAGGWRELFPRARACSVQAFVPARGTTWMAVVTGTVGREEHAELAASLVRRMAATIAVEQPDADATRPRPASAAGRH